MNTTRTVAIVPARGGSVGIPHKNIKEIGGRPLIHWVLDALTGAASVDVVYVSTDSETIAEVAMTHGGGKVRTIDRAAATATNTASTESVLLDFAQRVAFDRLVLVQATSPVLQSADVDAALALLDSGYDSVLSVVRQSRFLWQDNPAGARALNYDPSQRPRRQDWDGFLVENGALYATTRHGLESTGCRLSGKIGLVEMCEESYLELDSPTDWVLIDAMLRQGASGSTNPKRS
jgi:N-acylneuraminate cytidylyltransferase